MDIDATDALEGFVTDLARVRNLWFTLVGAEHIKQLQTHQAHPSVILQRYVLVQVTHCTELPLTH